MTAARQSAYNKEELNACAQGLLFGQGNAQLPMGQMLMVDRILEINEQGGKYQRGEVIAELDIHPEMWFFACHFPNDPVMPGCLGLDAMWQLVGFFLGWLGHPGHGRALGAGEVRFSGEVLPDARLLRYHLHIRRIFKRTLIVGLADGVMAVDGKQIYTARDIRVGLIRGQEKSS